MSTLLLGCLHHVVFGASSIFIRWRRVEWILLLIQAPIAGAIRLRFRICIAAISVLRSELANSASEKLRRQPKIATHAALLLLLLFILAGLRGCWRRGSCCSSFACCHHIALRWDQLGGLGEERLKNKKREEGFIRYISVCSVCECPWAVRRKEGKKKYMKNEWMYVHTLYSWRRWCNSIIANWGDRKSVV